MITQLSYTEQGSGIPCVLLHAFPLSSAMWQRDAARFAKICRVITPDLPGFGRSCRDAQTSIAAMAQAVHRLLEQLGLRQPVILGGLSMGGYVAFELLRQFPSQVQALALCSTKAAPDSPEQRAGRLKLIERLRQEGLQVLLQATLPKLVGSTTAATRAPVMAEVERLMMAADLEGVIGAVRAMAERADARPLLAAITCPTLVVAGSEDQLIPPEESRLMAAAIPGAQLTIIPQAGHLTNLEQPEAFQAAVEQWLRAGTFMDVMS